MEAEDILWIVPYAILAVGCGSIYVWKTMRAKRLLARAQSADSSGDPNGRADLLKTALRKANEKPELERSILNELAALYRSCDVSFDARDYRILVEQFQELSRKGSTKAIEELKQIQALKKQIIDRMPRISP